MPNYDILKHFTIHVYILQDGRFYVNLKSFQLFWGSNTLLLLCFSVCYTMPELQDACPRFFRGCKGKVPGKVHLKNIKESCWIKELMNLYMNLYVNIYFCINLWRFSDWWNNRMGLISMFVVLFCFVHAHYTHRWEACTETAGTILISSTRAQQVSAQLAAKCSTDEGEVEC